MKILSELYTRKFLPRAAETAALWIAIPVVALLFVLNLFIGAASISPSEVWHWLLGRASEVKVHNIMLYVRLPRGVAALVCGAALGLSGLLLQSALHNPLASAGTIGVNSGAGLFAVMSAAMFPGVFAARPVMAFIGAVFTAFAVFAISQRAGASRSTIIMVGVAVGSLMSAGTDIAITLRPESVMDKTAFFIGGFAQVSGDVVTAVSPVVGLGIIAAGVLASRMNVLALGDEVAEAVGLNVRLCRVLIIFCAALLAACAVCIGGLLGFVGLIVPHAARFLMGHDNRRLVPFTALLGGGLVICCDMLARTVFSPYEVPVGILLSLLGAPFFLALILRRGRLAL